MAHSADQAKVVLQRLGGGRDALDLEKEFQNAIKRLSEREAESLRERLAVAR